MINPHHSHTSGHMKSAASERDIETGMETVNSLAAAHQAACLVAEDLGEPMPACLAQLRASNSISAFRVANSMSASQIEMSLTGMHKPAEPEAHQGSISPQCVVSMKAL